MQNSIQFINRKNGKQETEKVYGSNWVDFFYHNPLGSQICNHILTRKWISKIVGSYKNTRHSAKAIPQFVKDFGIPMQEYESATYRSFNDFFIRKFKPSSRTFSDSANVMSAFCEARYFGFQELNSSTKFQVKGIKLNALELLGGFQDKASLFEGGPCYIARLCPVDYHRFHYPDSGSTVERYNLSGKLDSVNPTALEKKPELLMTNERCVSILKTDHFGYLAYIEVGALCVGKIVQSQHELTRFKRGEEKGYFLFGGSTVILLGEPKAWQIDGDILENTKNGLETLIALGSQIGCKNA